MLVTRPEPDASDTAARLAAIDIEAALCPLLERYPELAASRVQLQPPPGSQKPVRFRQCRSY